MYKYKINRVPSENRLLNRTKSVDEKEQLLGIVQDQEASDIEERFARACDKYKLGYDFQVSKLAPYNKPGEYRLDFLVQTDWGQLPVAIDGEYAHKTAAQKETDTLKDFEFMAKTGKKYLPVERISYEHLMTQEDANDYVLEHYV